MERKIPNNHNAIMNNKIEIIQYKAGRAIYDRAHCLVPVLDDRTTYGMFLRINYPYKIEKTYNRKELNKIVLALTVHFPKEYKAKAIFNLYE